MNSLNDELYSHLNHWSKVTFDAMKSETSITLNNKQKEGLKRGQMYLIQKNVFTHFARMIIKVFFWYLSPNHLNAFYQVIANTFLTNALVVLKYVWQSTHWQHYR